MVRTLNKMEQKLVDALRSGSYLQTQYRLRGDNTYCCLGVACDISGLGEWTRFDLGFDWDYMGHSGLLPQEVADLFGWNRRQADALSNRNDDGRTFAEIADFIESEEFAELRYKE